MMIEDKDILEELYYDIGILKGFYNILKQNGMDVLRQDLDNILKQNGMDVLGQDLDNIPHIMDVTIFISSSEFQVKLYPYYAHSPYEFESFFNLIEDEKARKYIIFNMDVFKRFHIYKFQMMHVEGM